MLINPLFILVSPPLFHKIIKLNILDLESLTNIHFLSREKGDFCKGREISDDTDDETITQKRERIMVSRALLRSSQVSREDPVDR
jgi:hypothetical protein